MQELDLLVEYRPGKTNAQADALFHYPVSLLQHDPMELECHPVVAALESTQSQPESREEGDETTFSQHQLQDSQLVDIIKDGEILKNEERAREVALTSPSFTMVDGVLYHIEQGRTLRIVPPTCDRYHLFLEAHQGPFSGHPREAKMHGQLSKHYW